MNESQNLEVQDFHGSQNLEVQDFKESENLEFQDFSRSGNHEVKDLNSNQNLEVQDFNGSQNLEDQDFNGSKNLEVQDFSGSKNFEVQDFNGSQNLEILKTKVRSYCHSNKICSSLKTFIQEGEEIYVVGFPLFASHLHTGASIVSGIISNVAYADNKPVLLQSTAAVHCGASGGALVSMETGELLGMVTSHTKDANLSSSFPHINFSIPTDLLYKLVSAVKSGDVKDTLQSLVSDHMKSVWQLKKTVKEKPHITSKL
ncbi:hypothetical protein ACROYT_G036120 [Oculina patagonica]